MINWIFDKEYIRLFEETLDIINLPNREAGIAVGNFKGYTLKSLAAYTAVFPGAMAEVGSWVGGSARLISKTVPHKKLYCFDTFEGIPEIEEGIDPDNWLEQFRSDSIDVYDIAKKTTKDCKNIKLIKGIFPDSIPEKLNVQKFSFVHADADVYPSTKAICEFFYPRLTSGGIILFDDYGYQGAPGARKAVDEFFIDKPEKPTMIYGGQCIVIKAEA